jgi:hypothetical protein
VPRASTTNDRLVIEANPTTANTDRRAIAAELALVMSLSKTRGHPSFHLGVLALQDERYYTAL